MVVSLKELADTKSVASLNALVKAAPMESLKKKVIKELMISLRVGVLSIRLLQEK